MNPIPVGGRRTQSAEVVETGTGAFRLRIPSGGSGRYRLAQLDDSSELKRGDFPWTPPLELSLRARAGSRGIPGTWGFGLWNAPMTFSFGVGPTSPFPALPNAAWFFHASDRSFLSFGNGLPGRGFLAQTYRTRSYPAWWVLPGLAAIPLLAVRPASRWIRRFVDRKLLETSGAALSEIDVTAEHDYRLELAAESVRFEIDGVTVHETGISPRPPLALIIWVDNLYAAYEPDGRLRYGLHDADQPHWLEIAAASLNGRPLELLPAGSGPRP